MNAYLYQLETKGKSRALSKLFVDVNWRLNEDQELRRDTFIN